MHVADRLKHYLDDHHVACDLVPHPRTLTAMQSAHAAHVPSECMAKAVVVHHELGYVLAVVPSTHRVELGTLQDVLDRRLGLATEDEVSSLFKDCEVGAVPAIGTPYGVPMVLDDALDGARDIWFEGGDHETLVHMSGEAFRQLTRDAKRARFSHRAM